MRWGKNEKLFDKTRLGLLAIRLGEKWVSKRSAPFQLLLWPLEVGKEWKIDHVLEQVQEKSSRSIDARIVVANVEEIKVPAGTFESYRIKVYDNYTGRLSSEHWYSPMVKSIVKNKTYLASGVREEELLSFKSDDWTITALGSPITRLSHIRTIKIYTRLKLMPVTYFCSYSFLINPLLSSSVMKLASTNSSGLWLRISGRVWAT